MINAEKIPGQQQSGPQQSGQDNPEQQASSSSCALLSESVLTRVVALICLLAFAWVAWISRSFPPPFNPADVGPGEVPLVMAVGGMICSALLYLQGSRAGDNRVEIGRPAAVGGGVLIILAYVLAMPLVGFYLSSLVAIPLLMLVGGERRPLRLALGSVGFALFVYLCFQLALRVQFP